MTMFLRTYTPGPALGEYIDRCWYCSDTLARDWWLRRQGQLQGARWEFFPNEFGEIGPTRPLQKALDRLGILWNLNP